MTDQLMEAQNDFDLLKRSASYPFLSIATYWDVEYGDVLLYSDFIAAASDDILRHSEHAMRAVERAQQWPPLLKNMVSLETYRQRLVKDGQISWQGADCVRE